jgi:hypothetical protein
MFSEANYGANSSRKNGVWNVFGRTARCRNMAELDAFKLKFLFIKFARLGSTVVGDVEQCCLKSGSLLDLMVDICPIVNPMTWYDASINPDNRESNVQEGRSSRSPA